ncbi:hypothetical protein SAMCCGM7_pC1650 (plasmid) [Sinorhizobium americanum CCGM7]|nr:hypothetical protein SAMCCGM7_pC1650 [Sinorhizobium americanum CCGM7]
MCSSEIFEWLKDVPACRKPTDGAQKVPSDQRLRSVGKSGSVVTQVVQPCYQGRQPLDQ